MIGSTGSGKTTLINFFLNYYLGVKFTDNFRIKLINEAENQNISKEQAVSQTQDVTIYYIKPFNNKPGIRIIDTPGFGDTRGIEQDKIIAGKIHECFQNKVETLTTICFLVQASCVRLTINQNYILSQILQMFGKDVIENFVIMFSFADNSEPAAIQALEFKGDIQTKASAIADLIPKIPKPWFLNCNSSAFKNRNKDVHEDDLSMSIIFWRRAYQSFDELIKKIQKTTDASLVLTREVINERKNILNTIQHLRVSIQNQLNFMDKYKQTYQKIQQYDAAMTDSKEFIIPQPAYRMVKIDLKQGEYVTNCIPCNYTCHYPCYISDNSNKSGCNAIRNNYCTVCKNKCYWNVHQNTPYRIEIQTYVEQVEMKELKKRYFQNGQHKTVQKSILDGIENDMDQANVECLSKQNELMISINRLNEIALKPAVFKHQEEYLELMISEEKQSKRPGWETRIATLEIMKEDWRLIREACTGSGKLQLTQEFYNKEIKQKKQKRF